MKAFLTIFVRIVSQLIILLYTEFYASKRWHDDLSFVFTLAQISHETEAITSRHKGRNCDIANDDGCKNWYTNMPLYGHTKGILCYEITRINMTNT